MLARLLKNSTLASRLRAAARSEIEDAIRPLHKELKRLSEDVGRLHAAVDATAARAEASERRAALLEEATKFDDERRDVLAGLPRVLDEPRVVRRALAKHAA